MSFESDFARSKVTGFSLVELMVGMTIGFIAMVVIVQTLSVFEGHKRTTSATADAQENGLLALMAIETDIRRAAAGFNQPELFSCRKLFSHYQERSGVGAPIQVAALSPMAVSVQDGGAGSDSISVFNAPAFTGIAATQIRADLTISGGQMTASLDRAFGLKSDLPAPLDNPLDPTADLVVVIGPTPDSNCSLMQVSTVTGSDITITNGPAGKKNEYNAAHDYMTTNNWPGFGTQANLAILCIRKEASWCTLERQRVAACAE